MFRVRGHSLDILIFAIEQLLLTQESRNSARLLAKGTLNWIFRLNDEFNLPIFINIFVFSFLVTQRLLIFENLVCQLFSRKCQLVSLRLDIPDGVSLSSIYHSSFWCYGRAINLRYLHIRIHVIYLLHMFIEHAPNLERLSVHLERSWARNELLYSPCDRFKKPYQTYSHEVRQLNDILISNCFHCRNCTYRS